MEISSSKQFNDNECCVCFVAYDDDQSGKDWVACACGRWLHDDCADDRVLDSDGNECLCFVCLNRFVISSILHRSCLHNSCKYVETRSYVYNVYYGAVHIQK